MSRILESYAALVAACRRLTTAPRPHLCELDARTLLDIGIPRSTACPLAAANDNPIDMESAS
jgi:hypothetical protein